MSIYIGEIEDGQMEGKVILNVSTLSRLFLADEMTLETSFIGQGVSRTEIVFLSFTNDNVSVRYLLNTLRS
jgi:repressor of nif and glnA expression